MAISKGIDLSRFAGIWRSGAQNLRSVYNPQQKSYDSSHNFTFDF